MEKYYESSIKIGSSFGLGSRQPLDARTICSTVSDMNAIPDTRRYEGLVVYVEETKKFYRYSGSEFLELSVERVIASLTSDSNDIGLAASQGKVLKGLIDSLSSALNTAIQELEKTIEQVSGDITGNLNQEISNIQTQISAINKTLTALSQEDASLSERIDTLNSSLTSLQGIVTQIQNVTIKALQDKDNSQDEEIAAIKEKNTQQDTKISAVETKNTEQDGRIEALEEADTAQDAKITAVETKNTEQDKRLVVLEEADKAQDTKISAAETKNTEQDGKLQEISESIASLEEATGVSTENAGKVKIDSSSALGYLRDKLASDTTDIENGKVKVDIVKENDVLKFSTTIPIPVWKTL